MKHILYFNELNKDNIPVAGGKGANLGESIKAGFPVPEGFILTVNFFTPWIIQIKESLIWKEIIKSTGEKLKKNCDDLKNICKKLNFTEIQQQELNTALSKMPKETIFAVRSSSPEEDLDKASFAGGYETVLGVTRELLEKSIICIFSSVFDQRVIEYKKQNNIEINNPSIAVIIQKQIASDMSGVAFSLNPNNNCYDEAVINTNFGLGETVVSGQVTPDTYIINKVNKKILNKQVNSKDISLWLTNTGGTKEIINLNPFDQVLTDSQILEVNELVCRVEKYFNKPMDIEWAIQNKKLYLLQARPITGYILIFPEMITKPGEKKKLYMDFIVMTQGFSEPMSVLGLDIWTKMVLRGNGMPRGKDGMLWDIHGRHYLVLSHVMKVSTVMLKPFINFDKPTKQIFETLDKSEYMPDKKTNDLKGYLWGALKYTISMLGISTLKGLFNSKAALEDCKKASSNVWTFLHNELNDNNAFENQVNKALDGFSLLLKAVGGLVAALIAKWRIERLFKNNEEAKNLIIDLSMDLPGNPTAEMGKLMVKIASFSEFKKTNTIKEFITRLNKKEYSKEFLTAYNEYIKRFGCRGVKEIDIATPRISENIEQIFLQLKQIQTDSNAILDIRKRKNKAYDRLCSIAKEIGKERKFKKLAEIHNDMMGYREHLKYMYIVAIDILRKQVIKLGEKFVEEGRLKNIEQIFDLNISQITQAEKDRKLELIPLIENNIAPYKKVKNIKNWPRLIDSRGKILRVKREAKNGELIGEPIAPGLVVGKAKVLNDPFEKNLNKGEILVCRASEPSWAPVFINAGGIVMEIGGPLQHGAIIAREYGLPCVSSLEDATKVIKDGDLIEVDGSSGLVKVLGESVIQKDILETLSF